MTSKQSLLLHCCCAPCSTTAIERLQTDFAITLFFYNPNIFPYDEYLRRKAEVVQYAQRCGVFMIDEDSSYNDWKNKIVDYANEPEGGIRCEHCFEERLSKTAEVAFQLGFLQFTTTLTLSPHKCTQTIFRIGKSVRSRATFLAIDFKSDKGYQRSIVLSKQAGLYRQQYCGCEYSQR